LSATAVRAPSATGGERPRLIKVGLWLTAGALVFGTLAGALGAAGHTPYVLALAVVLLPVLVWKRPQLCPVVLLVAAIMVEQVGQSVSSPGATPPGLATVVLTPNIPLTPHIPLFRALSSVHLEGADVLLLMLFVVYLAKSAGAIRPWPRSQLSAGIYSLLCVVALGVVIGVSHHGSFRTALMETRPFVYLTAAYLLTTLLITNRRALASVLWAFVIATAAKALQGIYVWFSVRNMHPRPESMIGHEVAYIFGVYILLVAGLWLFGVKGKLRRTATWLLPVVLFANLVNDRRTAWVVLGAGLLVLVAIGLACLPPRRRVLIRTVLVALAISAVYFPAYWNKDGGLAQPARAVHSLISPDPRDAASDLYRVQEDANLKLNIKEGGLLGRGFGVPIDYALPIANVRDVDPLIAYIPHNGVYYMLMRMGILGGVAFWSVIAFGIIAGCRLARAVEPGLAVVGALLACALVGYAFEGSLDQGFFFYRIAFVTGVLLGLVEAAHRIRRREAQRVGVAAVPQRPAPTAT
jgi:hypothetical protein